MRYLILLLITLLFSTAQAQNNSSPAIEFKPERLKFKVLMHQCGSKKVKAINNSDADIMDPVFTIEGGNAFRVDRSFQKCPNPLGAGQVCSVYIAFCPHNAGTLQAKLFFSGKDTGIVVTGRARQHSR